MKADWWDAPLLTLWDLGKAFRMSLVCHPYVTRMYWYVIRMSLVCTRMSFVCHSYLRVCHSYMFLPWASKTGCLIFSIHICIQRFTFMFNGWHFYIQRFKFIFRDWQFFIQRFIYILNDWHFRSTNCNLPNLITWSSKLTRVIKRLFDASKAK